jgi:hypothetical protein
VGTSHVTGGASPVEPDVSPSPVVSSTLAVEPPVSEPTVSIAPLVSSPSGSGVPVLVPSSLVVSPSVAEPSPEASSEHAGSNTAHASTEDLTEEMEDVDMLRMNGTSAARPSRECASTM